MSGKGAKGLIMGKNSSSAANGSNKDKDKKKPISRSSRAGLQARGIFSTSSYPEKAIGQSTALSRRKLKALRCTFGRHQFNHSQQIGNTKFHVHWIVERMKT